MSWRYVKMWHKGISFTRENCALVYLIDPAGTRTTSDSFSNMISDYREGGGQIQNICGEGPILYRIEL